MGKLYNHAKRIIMWVEKRSPISGKVNELDLQITDEQMDRFQNRRQNGEHIQTIFSNLSAPEREFILTGITPEEWIDIFGKDEE